MFLKIFVAKTKILLNYSLFIIHFSFFKGRYYAKKSYTVVSRPHGKNQESH